MAFYIIETQPSFISKSPLFGKDYTLADIKGTCYPKNNKNQKYDFCYVTQDKKEIENFLKAYNKIMDNLKEEALDEMDEQGKKAIKSILKQTLTAWDVSNIMNKLETDALKEVGIYEEVQMYKIGLDLLSNDVKFLSTDEDDDSLWETYKDFGKNSDIISGWVTDRLTDIITYFSK